ncbi:hypothetical protein BUALT_Bualt03G0002600 [Buddleja alternifolia]|uniref:WPP domain-associated protein n=1 Tax=Buddleja alternifolia TaxID=168488 RepID=A0AAV6XS54_9LAMI|nr:hypothetical protein BUALT_Bualt03G0002600 [Buddleja alternifolia]
MPFVVNIYACYGGSRVASTNGDVIVSCENGFEKLNGENVLELVGGDETGQGNLADQVLEDLEVYWEDINDRLMISRMVSDSVVKGMVTAVGQEAAEKIATKELEVVHLKQRLQSCEVGTGNYEAVRLLVVPKAREVGNCGRFSVCAEACEKHDKMREDLHSLRDVAREQFKKAKKEIDCARGFNFTVVGYDSDMVALGGQEKQAESWLHVGKMLECLETTLGTVCTKADDILLSSKITLCEELQERDLSRELEDIIIKSVLRSLREEFEEKLWDQNTQFCGIHNVNWLEKLNNISSLRTQLDSIVKSLSISETGLVCLRSHDLEHLHHKAFTNHVTPTSLSEENKTLDESNTQVPESYDFQQLKHMSKEDLVNYFNIVITKMRRDHESAMHQTTEKYFCLKREYLKERGSPVTHRKDEEFDVLRKKIPEVIFKLEDFLLENERLPALTNNIASMGRLKDRLESLLSENRQLRDCLTDKKNEVKVLEAQVSAAVRKMLQQSLAEENMLNIVSDLKSTVEDSYIEASLSEEVYRCALRELIGKLRCNCEDSNMQLLMMQEIYDTILRTAAIPAETTSGYEIENSEIESLMTQGLSGMIFKEAIKDAGEKLSDLHREVQIEKEIRIYFETKALEKENDLRQEVEERERLKQEILVLETALAQKEKVANNLSLSFSKEREQFELASREVTNLREHASQQQTLAAVSNKELELLRARLLEAQEQIEMDKMEMGKLNQELDQTKEVLTDARKERNMAVALAQETHDKLLSNETREEKLREEMEMAINNIHGLTNLFDDFEYRISGAIKKNNLRLEDATSHLKTLTNTANALKRTGLIYKKRMEGKRADLRMAEAEVDLLGDEVDTLLRLLEKIYIALDHYSPILKHYPGIIEILKLVRRELSGESTKLSRSMPWMEG